MTDLIRDSTEPAPSEAAPISQQDMESTRASGKFSLVTRVAGEAGTRRTSSGLPHRSLSAEETSIRRPRIATGSLDLSVLSDAIELAETYDPDDPHESVINLGALRSKIVALWESAAHASHLHQEALALVESCTRESPSLSRQSQAAVLEGLKDLRLHVLAESNLAVLRSRFIDVGFTPLGVIEDDEANENDGAG